MSTRRMPAAERKKQILLSAIRVFARSTYHGATTRAIAEEAGVTEALLYRYFDNKREIFTEGIAHTASRLTKGLEALLEQNHEHPLKAILSCVDYFVAILDGNPDLARMIFLVLAELGEEDIRKVYRPYQKQVVATLTRHITAWQEAGYVDPDLDAVDTAWLFFGSYVILAQVKQFQGAVKLDRRRVVGLLRPFLTDFGEERLDAQEEL